MISLVYVFTNKNFQLPFSNIKKIYKDVDDNINVCIIKITIDGIYNNGLQGGYYNLTSRYLTYFNHNIPYYLQKQKYYILDLEILNTELKLYVDNNFYKCLDINGLNSKGFIINLTKVDSKIEIKENIVLVEIDTGITASKDSETVTFGKYSKDIDFNYFDIFNTTKTLIEYENNSIPLSLLTSTAEEKNFKFDIITIDNKTMLYSFYFNITNNKPYKFIFAAKYDWK